MQKKRFPQRVWIVATSILLVAAATMTTLFIKERNSHQLFVDTSKSCIQSFINSVDYTLCITDMSYGNVNFVTCDKYAKGVIADMDYLRTLGYETNYTYIGK